MHQTQIQFPDIRLQRRDSHKLRGYFAGLFRDRSTLLHNHFEDGSHIYRYPLVQYKVLENIPTLIGLEEGARLLIELFMEIREIEIAGQPFPVTSKNISSRECDVGINGQLYEYRFLAPWMALNQENHKLYLQETEPQRKARLHKILCSNMLSFMKGIDYFEEQQILSNVTVQEVPVRFKNQPMIGFTGRFSTNVQLPDFIGLGKSVSRGFGTIQSST